MNYLEKYHWIEFILFLAENIPQDALLIRQCKTVALPSANSIL